VIGNHIKSIDQLLKMVEWTFVPIFLRRYAKLEKNWFDDNRVRSKKPRGVAPTTPW